MLTFSWDRSYEPAQSGPFLPSEEPAAQARQVQHGSPRGRQPCPGHTKGRCPHPGTRSPAGMALPGPGQDPALSEARSLGSSKQPDHPVCLLWSVCTRACGLTCCRPFRPSAHHLTHRIPTLGSPPIAGIKVPPAPESFRTPRGPPWWAGQRSQVPGAAHLKASGVDDLVADGALHEHEVELAFLLLHRVLLPCLTAHQAHGRVGQHWLESRGEQRSAGAGTPQAMEPRHELLSFTCHRHSFIHSLTRSNT